MYAGLLAIAGCQGTASDDPPIVPIRNMYRQPRYNVQSDSDFFRDGRAMRPLVEGTVAREMDVDPVASTGWSEADQSWALTTPSQVVDRMGGMERLLTRGQDRFNIYCTPCHGRLGDGQGVVVQRGLRQAASYHQDRLRQEKLGCFYDVITNGFGAMQGYAEQIPVRDRWLIVAYVRALQLSQHASLDDVPADRRGALEERK